MSTVKEHITAENIRKKNITDFLFRNLFKIVSVISASFIVLVIYFIMKKGISPFITTGYKQGNVNFFDFVTGMMWLNGPVGESAAYAVGFAIINTLIASFGAIILATPVSVLTALFIAKIAGKRIGEFLRTIVGLLAAIPSIIYGVFGLGVITNFTDWLADVFNQQTSAGLSLLTTVLVLALMIMPTITVVSENAISSVKNHIEQGSLALGATKIQTYFKVVLTSAKSGIFSGIILGVGRALGEATAVSMVSGNRFSGIALNPFDTTVTLTSRMLLGIKETTGLDYDIRFSVGIMLLVVIVITNFALGFVQKRVGNISE
jgi:phosphate transport system permease protein